MDAEPPAVPTTQINPFDGSVAGAADIAFEKVHVRGLDNVDNTQLKKYINTYYSSPHFHRIEWIDDTSANFVFTSTSAASEALKAFTDTEAVDASGLDTLDLRPARVLQVTKDDGEVENHELQIRQATTSDVKKKGAHDASKFYLMNPEKDPREQRVRDRRDRIRGNVENGDYRRMHFDDQERKRRREEDRFDESMYDDDAGVQSADDDRRKRVRFGRRQDRDLFDSRATGRLRDRSASPMRGSDGDGRYGFGSDPEVPERRIRQRSFSPRRSGSNTNAGKELFGARADLAPASPIELFPNKAPAAPAGTLSNHTPSTSRELFPDKMRRSNHRRSDAIDASPNGATDRPRSLAERITGSTGSSLADRITRPATSAGGSLADRITRDTDDAGMKIRGNSGVSIKGRASAAADDLSIRGASSGGVKELFPVKTGAAGANSGKELFGEKLKGRGVARRTAASYF